MNNQVNKHLLSLENKLQSLAQGQDIGLTPEEAAIYGVENADTYYPNLRQTLEDEFADEPEPTDPI
jgi:hypothetical protein